MQEFAALGFSNMLDYITVDDNGNPINDFSKITREQAAAIKSITVEEYVERNGDDFERVKRTKFELHSKEGALTKLAAHLGIKGFKSKIELSGPGGGPIPIAAVHAHTMHMMDEKTLEMLAAGIDPAEQPEPEEAEEFDGVTIEGE